jgi:uncharacterized membrane-anchored protein
VQPIHLPTLGARFWIALCLASIFGANMGDLFARNLGLGHVAGLPFLTVALAIVIVVERSTGFNMKSITGSRSSSSGPPPPTSPTLPPAI